MDYLDELFTKWEKKVKNSSLKTSLRWYIVLAVTGVITCSLFTMLFCEGWLNLLSLQAENKGAVVRYDRNCFQVVFVDKSGFTASTFQAYEIFGILQYGCILIYSVAAILIVSRLYYKRKLEEPLRLLHMEAEAIAREDLSFCCEYKSEDEMGEICRTFDGLRKQLAESRQKNWDIMEAQRQLNAAFAHDLRTPLTVMKGYIEMITQFYKEGRMPEEKLYENLDLLYKQVLRMEAFSATMKEIHSIEEIKIEKKKQTLHDVKIQLEESIKGLGKASEKSIELSYANSGQREREEDVLYADNRCLLEAVENLLANALRFCRNKVEIMLEREGTYLRIYVKDDGPGFSSEEIRMAVKPYYTGDSEEGEHFGLGLCISRNLCEKHGGSLSLSNGLRGGAIVCAEFYCG